MPPEENKVVRLHAVSDDDASTNGAPSDLSTQHHQAAQPATPASFAHPAPFQLPMRVSYTLSSFGGIPAAPMATMAPTTVEQNNNSALSSEDKKLKALKEVLGGMLYLNRFDALVKLLSGTFISGLENIPMKDSKHTALAHLLNQELYLHPGRSLPRKNDQSNPSSNAFLINYLCSMLNDAEIDEMHDQSQQRYVREAIRILLDIEDVDCTQKALQRKELKPFHYIATSGNLEFVRLFIEKRNDLVPEIHGPEGEAIVEDLKIHYTAKPQGAVRNAAYDRANEIIATISEATTSRNLANGDYNRISPQEFIARLMEEPTAVLDAPKLEAPQQPAKALPAPKKARKPRQSKGLEPQ